MQQDLDCLVSENLARALGFAIKLSGSADVAEELVQDSLLRVARGFGSFDGRCSFRTWWFQILINLFRDRLRNKQDVHPLIADVSGGGDEPLEELITIELGEMVAQAISQLPLRQREVMVLITYEQLAVQEVCSVLEISAANVYSTLHVAREQLRQKLAPYLTEKE